MQKQETHHDPYDDVLDEMPEAFAGPPAKQSILAGVFEDYWYHIKSILFHNFVIALAISVVIYISLNLAVNVVLDSREHIYIIALALAFLIGFASDFAYGFKLENVGARLLWLPAATMFFSSWAAAGLCFLGVPTIWRGLLLEPFILWCGLIVGTFAAWFVRNLLFGHKL